MRPNSILYIFNKIDTEIKQIQIKSELSVFGINSMIMNKILIY